LPEHLAHVVGGAHDRGEPPGFDDFLKVHELPGVRAAAR
jgi:hypothetical protein